MSNPEKIPTSRKRSKKWGTQALETRNRKLGTDLLAYLPDALFQHIHGDIGLFFGHNQRRADAD